MNLYSKDSKRSPGIRSYALLDAFHRVRGLCVCDLKKRFYHPATCEATGCLQRVYLHFWRVDASLHG